MRNRPAAAPMLGVVLARVQGTPHDLRVTSPPKLGLVLSGGGARGAYEVGVLSWIAEHRPQVLDAVRVVSGSSVGAVNGVFLASRGLTPASVGELESVWRELHLERVLQLSPIRVAKMLGAGVIRMVRGQRESPAVGFVASGKLQQLIEDTVAWERLPGMVRDGRFDAVAVAATEIGSGRTHVFVDHHPSQPTPRWPHDGSLVGVTTAIGLEHVLASAAIPFLFAPVPVGDFWYTDGGVRQNTPLSPALRLGAERLLVVSLRAPDQRVPTPGAFPGLGQLLGKLLNSVFIDRMVWDLDRLDRINDILAAGERLYGPDFLPAIQREMGLVGRRPYRPVRYVDIHPTEDVGMLAARLLRAPHLLHSPLSGPLRSLLASDNLSTADGASYILFDGAFAADLIALGRKDAAEHAAALDHLLAPEPSASISSPTRIRAKVSEP